MAPHLMYTSLPSLHFDHDERDYFNLTPYLANAVSFTSLITDQKPPELESRFLLPRYYRIRRQCYYYREVPITGYVSPLRTRSPYSDGGHQYRGDQTGGYQGGYQQGGYQQGGYQQGRYQKDGYQQGGYSGVHQRIYQKRSFGQRLPCNSKGTDQTFGVVHYSDQRMQERKRYYSSSGSASCGGSISSSSDRVSTKLGKRFRRNKSHGNSATGMLQALPSVELTDTDIRRIEFMNSGLSVKQTYVCECLANLYFDDNLLSESPRKASCSTSSSLTSNISSSSGSKWRRISTGVPVIMLRIDPITYRQLLLIRLVELDTGFKLWEQEIDGRSGYRTFSKGQRTFHKFSYHFHQKRHAGLSFDSQSAAHKFYLKVREFCRHLETSFLEEPVNSLRQYRSSNRGTDTGSKGVVPPFENGIQMPDIRWRHTASSMEGNSISRPCCFQHVASLSRNNAVDSMKTLANLRWAGNSNV